jgi:hypothetical protein
MPPSATTSRWLLSSRAFGKSSSKERGRTTNPDPREFATGVVSPVTLLLNVHIQVTVTGMTIRRVARRTWGGTGTLTKAPPTPPPEDAANIAINKVLFPSVGHKCLMAKYGKKKKVHSRDTPKYTTFDDEGSSSDDNNDLTSHFSNLTKFQKKKINELIESINE